MENRCKCESLTLECNVFGTGITVLSLQGSSAICDNPSEIILLHSRYNLSSGTMGRTVCNDGAIELMGRSLRVEENCFTSQLQIKFNRNFVGNVVSCVYDNGTAAKVVGNYSIPSIGKLQSVGLINIMLLLTSRSPASAIRHQLGNSWYRRASLLLEPSCLQLLIHSL